MMQWLLIMLLFIFNYIFMNLKHPLAMGIMLLIQTLLICLMTGIMSSSFWFSYILFLVFLGGLLILFIYVTSLASNEMFSFSVKFLFNSLLISMLMITSYFLFNKILLLFYQNLDMKSIMEMNSYLMENMLTLNKLYNYPTNFLTIMLMIYLFITLIATVKITKLFKGPIRSTFN